MLGRLVVGCLVLIVINTLLYGFVTWLPTFFIQQGMDIPIVTTAGTDEQARDLLKFMGFPFAEK